jgi:hypothetical protein
MLSSYSEKIFGPKSGDVRNMGCHLTKNLVIYAGCPPVKSRALASVEYAAQMRSVRNAYGIAGGKTSGIEGILEYKGLHGNI